jgi:hypothetical protein
MRSRNTSNDEKNRAIWLRQDLRRDRVALGVVAVEQRRVRLAVMDERELPRQVVRVLHPGVHALAPERAVDVSRVAGEEHAPAPVLCDLTRVDPEPREPARCAQPRR